MKIGCLEVPEPSYLPLLWLAEWKAPAPLRPRPTVDSIWTFLDLLRPWSTVAQMNATKLMNVNQVIWRTQKVTSVVKGLTLHDKDKTMIPFLSVKTLTSLSGGFEWNEWIIWHLIRKLQLPSLHQTFVNTFLSINISKTKQPQQALSWHLNMQGSHQ